MGQLPPPPPPPPPFRQATLLVMVSNIAPSFSISWICHWHSYSLTITPPATTTLSGVKYPLHQVLIPLTGILSWYLLLIFDDSAHLTSNRIII